MINNHVLDLGKNVISDYINQNFNIKVYPEDIEKYSNKECSEHTYICYTCKLFPLKVFIVKHYHKENKYSVYLIESVDTSKERGTAIENNSFWV